MSGQDEDSYTSTEVDSVTTKTSSEETSSFTQPDMFAFSDDDSSLDSISECSDTSYQFESLDQALDLHALGPLIRGQRPNKRPKIDENSQLDLRPISFVRFNTRVGKPKPVTIKALLDSGGGGTLISKRFTSKLKLRQKKSNEVVWTTPGGNMTTNATVKTQFTLPELHDNQLIEWNLHVTEDLGAYDMIIGRDLLLFLGIDVRFSNQTVEWGNAIMPFKERDSTVHDAYHISDPTGVAERTDRIKEILEAKYEPANLEQVCSAQDQLSMEQRMKLKELLDKYSSLFDGTLGKWKGRDVKLDLKPDSTPYHAKAYPIPKCHIDTLKMEVQRLVELGVLKKVNRSEWAAPTFIIPKKDGTVRFISDFRELNKRIRRKPYPIPHIQDMLLNLEGFKYATSLDLNMGYYHIELDPASKRLCTIVLPFGKYEYQRIPMGLCNSPDIFQEKMSELIDGLDFI